MGFLSVRVDKSRGHDTVVGRGLRCLRPKGPPLAEKRFVELLAGDVAVHDARRSGVRNAITAGAPRGTSPDGATLLARRTTLWATVDPAGTIGALSLAVPPLPGLPSPVPRPISLRSTWTAASRPGARWPNARRGDRRSTVNEPRRARRRIPGARTDRTLAGPTGLPGLPGPTGTSPTDRFSTLPIAARAAAALDRIPARRTTGTRTRRAPNNSRRAR